jgi:hypothetical protein
MRAVLAIGILSLSVPLLVAEEGDKDKLVDNPMYGVWIKHKPGATATLTEKTTYTGGTEKTAPETKVVTYTLVRTSKDRVIVRAVVVEEELLGTVESSPTRHFYPAKLKQSSLDASHVHAKKGEEAIKWKGKEIKCKTLFGSYKQEGATIEFKAWYNESIPGGIVKQTRTTRSEGTSVTTTITLDSFKEGSERDKK